MGAFGFEVPTSDLVVKPSTFVISIAARRGRHVRRRVAARTPRRAHRTDGRAARLRGRVASPRPADRHRRRDRGARRGAAPRRAVRRRRDPARRRRRVRPVHRGRGARPGDRPSGRSGPRRAAAALARHAGPARSRERGPQPAADRVDRRGADDRGRARRSDHDLRQLVEAVDQRSDRPGVPGDLVVRRRRRARLELQPRDGRPHRQGPRRRGREPAAVRRVRGERLGPVPARVATRTSSTACSTSIPAQGDLTTLGPNQIAVSKKVFDDKHWKLGQQIDDEVPAAGRGAGDDRRRLRPRPARRPRPTTSCRSTATTSGSPRSPTTRCTSRSTAARRSRTCGRRSRRSPSSSPGPRSTTSAA